MTGGTVTVRRERTHPARDRASLSQSRRTEFTPTYQNVESSGFSTATNGRTGSRPNGRASPPPGPGRRRSVPSRTVRFRKLGSSDLQVSEISLGSWLTYSGGVEADATAACTRAAFEAGITFFDTANVYGRGASETAWGEILADYRREDYVLATKVYFPMSDDRLGPVPRPDREADRRLAAAAAHRPRRPLPVPPVRRDGCRSRTRWRRSPRSSAPARPATSGSASGRPTRSGPGSRPRRPT